MQTLKTAAIVVLLMTVMYGAYVSLTTPPEPLPPDVESMIVMSDEGGFSIDASLPESLGELEINSGAPEAFTQPATQNSANLSTAAPDMASSEFNGGDESGFATTFSDSPASAAIATAGDLPPASQALAAMATDALAPAQSAPTSAPPALVTDGSGYPRTNRTFEVPDPQQAASAFAAASDNVGDLSSPPASEQIAQVAAVQSGDMTPPSGTLRSAQGLANAIRTADRQYAEDQRKEALATLSIFYSMPSLSGEARSELLSRLDPLAAEVIYSGRHLLEVAHRVGQSETLMEIAARYEVPWQLLANINQIKDPVTIVPGTELKVVRGPFRAEVDLTLGELTVFLGDLYAGRFPIAVGADPSPKPGTFTIQDKQTSRTYYDASGAPIAPGSLDNPYGNVWLDLGGQLCIHGSPSASNPTDKGCISLAADYADDLYGILSRGSSVTIRR